MKYARNQTGISTLTAILLLILAGLTFGYYYSKQTSTGIPKSSVKVVQATNPQKSSLDFTWPPAINKTYPDLQLVSHTGEVLKLSSLKGKVILLEPIGMNCVACNAFSGGHIKGGYQGNASQEGVHSIEEYLPQHAGGVTLDDERLVLVQLILFDRNLKTPTPDDARKWAEHFEFDNRENVYVIVGDERFLDPSNYRASYNLIPGFQLIDKDFILRSDATGHRPKNNLFTQLLPMIPWLLEAVKNNEATVANDNFRLKPDTVDLGMTVDKAYKAIPHKQTTFRIDTATMVDGEKNYLHRLFTLVDLAVVERVQTLIWHQTGGRRGAKNNNYDQILTELDNLSVPSRLNKVHDLVHQAVQEQAQYFSEIDDRGNSSFNPNDRIIQTSHAKLIKAYNLLLNIYPEVDAHNKQAFFDHLCALDFI